MQSTGPSCRLLECLYEIATSFIRNTPNRISSRTLNLYAYVFNNPLRFIDEKGFSAADRVKRAADQLGKPYGGKGPDSFDCSGLASFSAGKDVPGLPDGAAQQYKYANNHGDFTTDPGQVQPGDEVFLEDKDGNVVHVGVVESVDQNTGAITMVEAAGHDKGIIRKTITKTKAGSAWGSQTIKGYGLWHNFDQAAQSQTANNGGWWSRIVNYWSPLWYIAPAPPLPSPTRRGTLSDTIEKTALKTILASKTGRTVRASPNLKARTAKRSSRSTEMIF